MKRPEEVEPRASRGEELAASRPQRSRGVETLTEEPRRHMLRPERDPRDDAMRVTFSEITHMDPLHMMPGGHNVVAVLPAHNEEDDLYDCLQSLYEGTQWPDLAFVVANNCTDDTLEVALRFQREHPNFPLAIHNVEGLEGRKVGALCYAWEQLEGVPFDYFVSMDGDVILDEYCLEDLYEEIDQDKTIGGVSARYNFLPGQAKGLFSRLMLFYQRMDFTSWTSNLLMEKDRETYVLGGQVSIMSGQALRELADLDDRIHPWSHQTAVEDMELTWKMNDLGWSTHCSAVARAWVGFMPTRASLQNFQGANADFTFADAKKADFTKANLVGANFFNADTEGANFKGAVITGLTCPNGDVVGKTAYGTYATKVVTDCSWDDPRYSISGREVFSARTYPAGKLLKSQSSGVTYRSNR